MYEVGPKNGISGICYYCLDMVLFSSKSNGKLFSSIALHERPIDGLEDDARVDLVIWSRFEDGHLTSGIDQDPGFADNKGIRLLASK